MAEEIVAPRGTRNRWVPVAVLGVFVLPILVAWWFAILHPEDTPQRLLNHGALIEPPLDFSIDPAGQALAALALAPSEWGLMYYGACATDCVGRIERLTTIRSLLGAHGARVHVAALVDVAPAAALAQAVIIADARARAFLAREVATRTGVAREQGIVILDSRRLAMMVFAVDASPAGIKDDLKRLLRGSAIH